MITVLFPLVAQIEQKDTIRWLSLGKSSSMHNILFSVISTRSMTPKIYRASKVQIKPSFTVNLALLFNK